MQRSSRKLITIISITTAALLLPLFQASRKRAFSNLQSQNLREVSEPKMLCKYGRTKRKKVPYYYLGLQLAEKLSLLFSSFPFLFSFSFSLFLLLLLAVRQLARGESSNKTLLPRQLPLWLTS